MVNPENIAWLSLRIVYAWMFLYPAVGLVRDWPTTVQTTSLLFKRGASLFAFASLVIMVSGALGILVGFWGQVAAAGLLVFNLGGALIHYRLGAIAKTTRLSPLASDSDQTIVQTLSDLAVVGHVTSAEKNFVLAAVALFFLLLGTGPWSLTPAWQLF